MAAKKLKIATKNSKMTAKSHKKKKTHNLVIEAPSSTILMSIPMCSGSRLDPEHMSINRQGIHPPEFIPTDSMLTCKKLLRRVQGTNVPLAEDRGGGGMHGDLFQLVD